MEWVDIAGWLGALFTFSAYSMRNMKLLRTVAVAANVSFIIYGATTGVYPMLALHLLLLPMNLYRLNEILSTTRRIRAVRSSELPIEYLQPFLKPNEFAEGHVLFRRGDPPDQIYFLREGQVELPELRKTLGSETLFGEMAYFSSSRSRTTSAICRTPCRIMSIDEEKFMQVFQQHPEFGFYVIRLMAQRLIEGSQNNPRIYEDFATKQGV